MQNDFQHLPKEEVHRLLSKLFGGDIPTIPGYSVEKLVRENDLTLEEMEFLQKGMMRVLKKTTDDLIDQAIGKYVTDEQFYANVLSNSLVCQLEIEHAITTLGASRTGVIPLHYLRCMFQEKILETTKKLRAGSKLQ